MKIIVLGSAAGGGFPQWNCNCHNCSGLRSGTLRATARTQSSIAVSSNGHDWVLVNASPGILAQIRATPALQPGRAKRDSGIAAVMLMDAQIDHVTGLLMLREGKPLDLESCLALEYRLSQRFMASHDFYEGVRALLIDKDLAPKWRPASLGEVTEADIAAYFAPLPEGDLVFPDHSE